MKSAVVPARALIYIHPEKSCISILFSTYGLAFETWETPIFSLRR
jgi:hypothetical protein